MNGTTIIYACVAAVAAAVVINAVVDCYAKNTAIEQGRSVKTEQEVELGPIKWKTKWESPVSAAA